MATFIIGITWSRRKRMSSMCGWEVGIEDAAAANVSFANCTKEIFYFRPERRDNARNFVMKVNSQDSYFFSQVFLAKTTPIYGEFVRGN